MAEWSKAAASKAVILNLSESGVRIPLSPPTYAKATVGTDKSMDLIVIVPKKEDSNLINQSLALGC